MHMHDLTSLQERIACAYADGERRPPPALLLAVVGQRQGRGEAALTHSRRAADILEQAYTLLQEWAAALPDAATRRMFVDNVRFHREIVAAWELPA